MKLFNKKLERKTLLFDYLVKSIPLYGDEIWGWSERKEMEAIQEKYIRWILGVRQMHNRLLRNIYR